MPSAWGAPKPAPDTTSPAPAKAAATGKRGKAIADDGHTKQKKKQRVRKGTENGQLPFEAEQSDHAETPLRAYQVRFRVANSQYV